MTNAQPSIFKDKAIIALTSVFMASLCYNLFIAEGLSLLRVFYSFFLYLSIAILLVDFFSVRNRLLLNYQYSYALYFIALILFIVVNSVSDYHNPAFRWATFLNNPIAMLAVVPVFGFITGYISKKNLQALHTMLLMLSAMFVFSVFFLQSEHQSVPDLFSTLVLPLLAVNLARKKYFIYSLILIIILVYHCMVADYRTGLLRVAFFVCLYVGLWFFRRSTAIRIVITGIFLAATIAMLTNLESILDHVSSSFHLGKFEAMDTRSFIFDEFFTDLNTKEVIFGRGFSGTYFSPYFLSLQNTTDVADSFYRFDVEVGFLQLILKGGLFFLLLYLIPLISTLRVSLGKYREELRVEYVLSIYILSEIFIFFFENTPSYHFHFFLLFFLAGYIHNKST